jgi:hypothetical protein
VSSWLLHAPATASDQRPIERAAPFYANDPGVRPGAATGRRRRRGGVGAEPFITGGPVATMLRTKRLVAYLLIVSVGAILAATLPPGMAGFDQVADGVGSCHIHRLGLAAADDYFGVTETSLNVLLFIPLGLALALLPWSRRTVALIGAAFALPIAIEATQLLVPMLGRACESGDVIDNMVGLLIGLVVGGVAMVFARVATARRGATPT